MWLRLAPRVRPTMVPRAYISQYGAPSRRRPDDIDAIAVGRRPSPVRPTARRCRSDFISSRSHWTAAPATKMLPSSAYSTVSPIPQAIVVSKAAPRWGPAARPCSSTEEQPVPVFGPPSAKTHGRTAPPAGRPSPAIRDHAPPKVCASVPCKGSFDGLTSGNMHAGIVSSSRPLFHLFGCHCIPLSIFRVSRPSFLPLDALRLSVNAA